MLETGKVLQERYRIEKQIGQGGMGSVYLATDERFNSTVAIKETLFADDTYRKAFKREARLLNSLKHTALPKVSDHYIDGNSQYIVMEYISGDDLFEMMEQSGEAFPLEDVLIWAEQLLDALEYLHGQENPIIHRDIKPQNLKITPQGQVILLDFGLAKGNPTDANHQTAANSIFGYSRNYASLEQIQGTGTDPRSDIYSLAATLYHLVTGKTPADALTRVMMVLNEEKDPLQPANVIHDQVPEAFANSLQEAMSLNANLRPQSAAEMRELIFNKQKTAVTTKPNTVPNKAAGANLLTQNTKVFTDENNSGYDSKQSDIKTELLSNEIIDGNSIKTKIASPRTFSDNKEDTQNNGVVTQSFSGRKPLLAAAAIGMLFFGSVLSMVYMWSPESSSNGIVESNKLETNSSMANTATLEKSNTNANMDDSNSIFTTSNTNSGGMDDVDKKESEKIPNQTDVAGKKETTSSKETVKATGNNRDSKDNNGSVIIKNGKIITDGKTITNGRVETDEATIDEKGIILKKGPKSPPKYPPELGISREKYEKLSDEEKLKIRNALELRRRMNEKNRRVPIDKRIRDPRRIPPPPKPIKP